MSGISGMVRRRLRALLALPCFVGAAFAACGGDPQVAQGNDGGAGGQGTGGGSMDGSLFTDNRPCQPGEFMCSGAIAQECDGMGGVVGDPIDCASRGERCANIFGCVLCLPGEQSCDGGVGRVCKQDGSGFDEFECDSVQGMVCEADGCKGACTPPSLFPSYLGCEFFPTVTRNAVWEGFDFAVAVANAGDATADVVVTRGGTMVDQVQVAAGGLEVIRLPWVDELKGGQVDACQSQPSPGATQLVGEGAYRLRTNQPVTVYQFSPLEFELDPVPNGCLLGRDCPGAPSGGTNDLCLSYSNDATLLLPVTVLSANYATLAWPSTTSRPSLLAVTATQDGTDVQVFGNASVVAGGGIDGSGNGTVSMDRGDVLQILADHAAGPDAYGADLTGTGITANKPIQVIAGNSCANIPEPRTEACDHVEHAMLPAETLGTDYILTFPAAPASQSPHVVRVVAVEADTTVEFSSGVAATQTISPGDPPIEVAGMEDFQITSDKPILVTQHMQGQRSVMSNTGDPSLSVAVPTQQFRTSYIFIASSTFDFNFVNIVAPTGASVTLDGTEVPAGQFQEIGTTGFSVARHELSGSSDVHTIESGSQFGVTVYGYGRFTSYMYPGGLDLKRIAPPPVF